MTASRRAGRWPAIGVLTALLALSGCGPGQRGHVEGKVLLDGKEVLNGRVTFLGADGQAASSEILGGDYRVADVAAGEAKIVVVSQINAPDGLLYPGRRGPEIIPARYTQPDSSPLKYRVEAGAQKHNIELQP